MARALAIAANIPLLLLGLISIIAGVFNYGVPLLLTTGTSLTALMSRHAHPALFWGALLGSGLGVAGAGYIAYTTEPQYLVAALAIVGAFALNIAAIVAWRRTARPNAAS